MKKFMNFRYLILFTLFLIKNNFCIGNLSDHEIKIIQSGDLEGAKKIVESYGLEACDENGNTILTIALAAGDYVRATSVTAENLSNENLSKRLKIARYLINLGANIEAVYTIPNKYSSTPIVLAIQHFYSDPDYYFKFHPQTNEFLNKLRIDFIEFLISKNANLEVALKYAVLSQDLYLTERFCELTKDVDKIDAQKLNPKNYAEIWHNELISRHFDDPDARASIANYKKIIEILDIYSNYRDNYGLLNVLKANFVSNNIRIDGVPELIQSYVMR